MDGATGAALLAAAACVRLIRDRVLTRNGLVSTMAGQAGTSDFADGTGVATRIFGPEDVTVDALGTAYVADLLDRTIRKITSAGVVSRLAGTADHNGATTDQAQRLDLATPRA